MNVAVVNVLSDCTPLRISLHDKVTCPESNGSIEQLYETNSSPRFGSFQGTICPISTYKPLQNVSSSIIVIVAKVSQIIHWIIIYMFYNWLWSQFDSRWLPQPVHLSTVIWKYLSLIFLYWVKICCDNCWVSLPSNMLLWAPINKTKSCPYTYNTVLHGLPGL